MDVPSLRHSNEQAWQARQNGVLVKTSPGIHFAVDGAFILRLMSRDGDSFIAAQV